MSETVNISKELYCQFLIAGHERYSAVELAKLFDNHPAHDSYTRWLNTVKLKPHIIWEYAQTMVDINNGYLIVDDSVLDKWYGRQIECAYRQYSGKHHRVVNGIGVVNLIWNVDKEHIPIDFRIFDKPRDGKKKTDHCHDMLTVAYQRGFRNITVLMDCGYNDLSTLKRIRACGWKFVCGIEPNRVVSFTPHVKQSVADIATPQGIQCHLRGYGCVKILKLVRLPNDGIDYLATNDLSLSGPAIRQANDHRWKVEETHRGEKQTTGVEDCQFRGNRAQRNHIFCSTLAFLAAEKYRLEHGISWYESKHRVIADALRDYMKKPFIKLPSNATATG